MVAVPRSVSYFGHMREHVTVMAQWQAGNWVHSFMHMVQVDWCFRWITWLFEWLWGVNCAGCPTFSATGPILMPMNTRWAGPFGRTGPNTPVSCPFFLCAVVCPSYLLLRRVRVPCVCMCLDLDTCYESSTRFPGRCTYAWQRPKLSDRDPWGRYLAARSLCERTRPINGKALPKRSLPRALSPAA